MSIKLDLSQFKHVSSDKHSTTLEHKLGHKLTLSHKNLNEANRKQLEALAEGGKVKSEDEKDAEHKEHMSQKETERKESHSKFMNQHESNMSKMNKAMKRPKYDEGGLVDEVTPAAKSDDSDPMSSIAKMAPMLIAAAEGGVIGAGEIGKEDGPNMYAKDHQLPCLNPNCKSHGAPHPNCRCYGGGGEWGRMAKGGKVTTRCAEGMPHDEGCEYYKEGGKVGDNKSRYSNEQGVHTRHTSDKPGQSLAGQYAESAQKPGVDKELKTKQAKSLHSQHLEQLKNMPKAKIQGFDEGGNVNETPAQAANRKQMELMTKGAQEGGAEQRMPQSDTNRQAEDEARFADGGEILPPGMQKPEGDTLNYKDLKKEYIEKKKQIKIDDRGKQKPARKMYAHGTEDAGAVDDAPITGNKDHDRRLAEMVGHGVRAAVSGEVQPPAPMSQDDSSDMPPSDQGQSQLSGTFNQSPAASAPNMSTGAPDLTPSQDNPNNQPAAPSAPANQPSAMPAAQQLQQQGDNTPDEQDRSNQFKKMVGQGNSPEYAAAVNMTDAQGNPLKGGSPEANLLLDQASQFHNDLINGHVDTPTLHKVMYDGKGFFGKIGTIFGLMIGGAGAGLTHSSNSLLDAMNAQVQNQLDAQSKSKANAQNLLRINQDYIRNNSAVKLTNAQTAQLAQVMTTVNVQAGALKKMADITNSLPPGSTLRQQAEQKLALMYKLYGNNVQDKATAATGMAALGNLFGGASGPSGGAPGAVPSSIDQGAANQLRTRARIGDLSAPSEEAINRGIEQGGKVDGINALQNSMLSTYDHLDKLFLAGKLSPNDRKAAVSKLSAEMTTKYGYSPDQAQAKLDDMLPKDTDWKSTRKTKRNYINQNFDVMRAGAAPDALNAGILKPYTPPAPGMAGMEGKIFTNPTTGERRQMTNGKLVQITPPRK